ncbi:MAG: cold shock domain-containing protein [Anaerohalosphaeraceae bacterium]
MPKGTVKWFDDKKGFGFVVNENGQDVFVHYSHIQTEGYRTLRVGQLVEYAEMKSPKGLQGQEIHVIGPLEPGDKTEKNSPPQTQ